MEKQQYINYESDFTLLFRFVGARPTYPWRLEFYSRTNNQTKYVASYDGVQYINCAPVPTQEDAVLISFDNHHLGCGILVYKFCEDVSDDFFADKKRNTISPRETSVILCNRPSNTGNTPPEATAIIASLIKGETGFSPIVAAVNTPADTYRLRITSATGVTETPDLLYGSTTALAAATAATEAATHAENGASNANEAVRTAVVSIFNADHAANTATTAASNADAKATAANNAATAATTAATNANTKATAANNAATAATTAATNADAKATAATTAATNAEAKATAATTAANNANTKATAANNAATSATSAATNADAKATAANNAATAANNAATAATTAASNANTKATAANNAATAATTAATNANTVIAALPAWAKTPTKPVYTAAEVGAEPVQRIETIADTTATLDVVGGITYLCGEMVSLTLATVANAPREAVIRFTSGAIATTLTLPFSLKVIGYVKPVANRTYEISICNGAAVIVNL